MLPRHVPDFSITPAAGAGLKTVLVIDDDPRLRPVLVQGLEAHGYLTLQAPNTKIGGELARQHLPDVIVCDIDMPGQDGKSFLRELRLDPELGDRQFVLMTGDAANASTRSAMELGADDFLLKPFSLGALAGAVAARLKRAEISRHLETRVIEQLRGSLNATLPHEFFTPLAGIFGLTEMLDEELEDLSKEEIREVLHDVLKSARRLHRTLRNYLHIISLDAPNRAPPDWLSAEKMSEAFNHGVKTAADRHRRAADVTAEVVGVGMRCGLAECTALAEELVDNALSFSKPGTPVSVVLKPEKDLLCLTVTDQGRGMTPKQVQQLGLFQQHERKKFEQQGLGLGLALVKRIVLRLGGEFRIASETDRGTTISITIPYLQT